MHTFRSIRSLIWLLVAALALPLFWPGAASAASFDLTGSCPAGVGDVAALKTALTTADGNGEADTITLAAGCVYTLTTEELPTSFGHNGLPPIRSAITIDGNGATIQRSSAVGTPKFRFFSVETAAGNLTLNNLTLTGGDQDGAGFGTAWGGGALHAHTGATLTINASNVLTNTSNYGGAIDNYGGTIVVNTTLISGNTATVRGGAVNSGSGGSFSMSDSTVASNKAIGTNHDAGGLYLAHPATITNSTIHNNSTTRDGGGLFAIDTLTVRHSTITANTAGRDGGGARVSNNGTTFSFGHTIVAGNTAGRNGPDISEGSGTLASAGYNLVQNVNGHSFNSTTGHITGQNPNLGPLQNNGGPTPTRAPLAGSPAINAGNPAIATPPATDQRGFDRIRAGRIDIGAVEVQFQPGPAFIVNTLADPGSDGVCTDDECSLREAVTASNTNADASTVTFSVSGTITLANGQLAVTTPITITEPAGGITVNGNNASRIFRVNAAGNLTLNGLTLTGGNAAGSSGGGIYNAGTTTISGTQVLTNTSPYGGGISNDGGTLTVQNSTLSGNRATTNGGGIYNEHTGTLTVQNSTLRGNRAANGGGIHNYSSTLTVQNSTLSGNTANSGGGILNNGGTLTVQQSTFAGNTASTFGGGGIINSGGTLTVQQSTLSANTAGFGGGIYNYNGGTLTVETSTLSGNSATGTASASDGGGALDLFGGTVVIRHSTIVQNSAANTARSGIWLEDGTLTLDHTLVAQNGGTNDLAQEGGTLASQGYNLIGANATVTVAFPAGQPNANGDIVGTAAAPIDPQLGPLQNNGGPTLTHEPLAGSPAIDAGNPAFAPPPATDQRGLPRVQNGRIDIGAVETNLQAGPAFIVNTLVDPGSDGVCTNAECSLREAIAAANANADANEITFSVVGTITLLNGDLGVTTPIIITEPAGGITVSGNNASRIYNVSAAGNLTLNGLTLTGGNAGGGNGGAIYNAGTTAISGTQVLTNTATYGGGIYNDGGTLTVQQSTVSGNTATFGGGGGIYSFGTLTVEQSTFASNTANSGGGIINFGTLTVQQSTLSGNTAGNSGGIYNQGTLTVETSTLSGNSATGTASASGGGALNLFSGTVVIRHSTIVQNSAANTARSGIWLQDGTLTLDHTLVAQNGGTNDLAQEGGTLASQGYNLIGANATVEAAFPAGQPNANGDIVGTAAAPIDPQLGPLADNGGPTLTHLPLIGSPAISSGDPNFTPPPAVDQRGEDRVQLGRIDIGAVEAADSAQVEPGLVVNVLTDPGSDGICGVVECSLREAVTAANADPGATIITFSVSGTITLLNGELGVTTPMTIIEPADGITVSGNNASRIFNVDVDGDLTLNGLMLTNGNSGGGLLGGGAIYNAGTTTISGTHLLNNQAFLGGAVFNVGTLNARGSSFAANFGFIGGAILNGDLFSEPEPEFDKGPLATPSATIDRSVFSENISLGGGGIFNLGELLLTNSTFEANVGGQTGGGILNIGILEITASTFSQNSAPDASAIGNTGTLTMTNSTLSGNVVGSSGGPYPVPVARSRFSDDAATAMLQAATAIPALRDLQPLAADPSATGGAFGQAFNGSTVPTALIQHSTIVDNLATDPVTETGGILVSDGVLTLSHTIVAGNDFADIEVTDGITLTSAGYNLIGDNTNVEAQFPAGQPNANGDIVGTAAAPIDPTLGPLQSNGGSTLTHLPLFGSPAIDAGDPAFAPPPATDQRGAPRVQNGRIDIGAVEVAPITANISDASATEGDVGTTPMTFTVTLDMTSTQSIAITYTTVDGTATAGTDYTAANGTLVFAPNETTHTIIVQVLGDIIFEPNETFSVVLTPPTGVNAATAIGTIINDDTPPAISISDVTVVEGNANSSVAAVFTATLDFASSFPVTVTYATADGTATAGTDYTAASGMLVFAPGETEQFIEVYVTGDDMDEPDETFTVTLSDPINATIADGTAIGTIIDDDTPPAISISDASGLEGDVGTTTLAFSVTLDAPSGFPISVTYATADGTATAGTDYTAANGMLVFAPGTITQTISIAVLGDTVVEADETFTVTLSDPVNATIADGTATGTIINDDSATPQPTTLFLPMILNTAAQTPQYPDLVVEAINVTATDVQVVIRNIGQGAVTQPFWVDLYINPGTAPAAPNQTWPLVGNQGMVWGVINALQPGQALTLSVGDSAYVAELSRFTAPIPAGTTLYAQVDSANTQSTYGGVLESHEANGGAYNNVLGPQVTSIASSPPTPPAPTRSRATSLPPRE